MGEEIKIILSQLDRMESKQNNTDKNVSDLTMTVHDIKKTTDNINIPTVEEIRCIAKEEIKKSGPFNLGWSKKQIAVFVSGLTATLGAIAAFIKTVWP